jgi:hypothetical protein
LANDGPPRHQTCCSCCCQIHDREATIANGGGAGYVCGSADCCEPLSNERRSALIARVFVVGNRTRFTAPQAARVFLRINDCDDGLGDNGVVLEVRIVP